MRGRCEFTRLEAATEPSSGWRGHAGAAKVAKAHLKSKQGKVVERKLKEWSTVGMWHQTIEEPGPSGGHQRPAEASGVSACSLISE